MKYDPLTIDQEISTKLEKWYSETYKDKISSPEVLQLLILHKLHQVEERLKVLEHQTKTNWVN